MTSVLLPEGELRVARCDMLDKLIAVGDGDAALLYLYILRHGGTDGSAAARALRLSADRYERAAFTLNNLIAPMEKTKAATDKSAEAPRYTGDELRRARLRLSARAQRHALVGGGSYQGRGRVSGQLQLVQQD